MPSDQLYVTDDIVDRLDPMTLEEDPPFTALSDEPFYREQDRVEVPKQLVTLSFFHEPNELSPIVVDGQLQLMSFGAEGWRCSIDGVEPEKMLEIARRSTVAEVSHVRVHDLCSLSGSVDVTTQFGNLDGSCSVSVAADVGVAT